MNTPFLNKLVALGLVAVLVGCAGIRQRKTDIEGDYAALKARLQQPSVDAGNAAGKPIVKRVAAAVTLPAEFDEMVTLSRGDIVSAEDLTRRLFRIIGAPIRVTREVEDFLVDRVKRARDGKPAVINPNSSAVQFAEEGSPLFNLTYTGSKRGLIDAVAARIGCYWRWENQTVVFYMTDTKTYFITALPGSATSTDSTKSGGGDTSGIGAGTKVQLEITAQQSIWEEMQKTVRSMLSSFGRVVASPSIGSLVVTDTPDSLERVSKFIGEQNRFLSKQVALEVQVFNLTLSDDASMGVDVNLATSYLSKYGIQLVSGGGVADPRGSSFALSVLDSATGAAGKWKGSSVIVTALQAQGNVSNHRNANLMSLNNHAVPLLIGRTTSYLAQSSVATTANVGSTSSLTPGTITEGYSLKLTPTILEDGAVMVQMAMNISQLRQLRTVSSGSSKIELPETDEQNTIQRAILRSGETLMLAGFEQNTKSYEANTGILSLGQKGGQARTLLVVLVTPNVSASR